MIDIFEPLRQAIVARGTRRVAVFGTRFVMESSLFGLAGDVEIIQARLDATTYIHNSYVELARRGMGTDEQYRSLTTLAHTLQQRDGVDAIILAGTDLSLLFNEENTAFSHIDCAALHIRAILDRLIG